MDEMKVNKREARRVSWLQEWQGVTPPSSVQLCEQRH